MLPILQPLPQQCFPFHFSPIRGTGAKTAQQTNLCSGWFYKHFLYGNGQLSARLASLMGNSHTFNDPIKVRWCWCCVGANHAGSLPVGLAG